MYKRIWYDRKNNNMHIWYVDSDGKHRRAKVKPKIEYFVEDRRGESDHKDIYGNSMKLMTSENTYKMRDFVKDSGMKTCESSLTEEVKFLQKHYKKEIKVDMSNLQIATFDIECAMDKWSPPEEAAYPINLICIHFSRENEYHMFGLHPYTGTELSDVVYHHCPDEKNLLIKFVKLFRSKKVDILTGWYMDLFDVPYVINRMKNLDIDIEKYSLSPVNVVNEKETRKQKNTVSGGYEICGLSQLDGRALYMKFEQKKRVSYSLEAIGQIVCKEGKKKYDGNINTIWKTDWNVFCEYNYQDVALCRKIEAKKKYIELSVRFCYGALVPFEKVYSSIAIITGYMVKYLHSQGFLYPDPIKQDKEAYPGGYVMARVGYYKYAVSYDFESLYPNIMMASNIDPSTIVMYPDDEEIKHGDLIRTPASDLYRCKTEKGGWLEFEGIWYRQDKRGIIPQVVEKIFGERKYWKNLGKVADGYKAMLDVKQIASNYGFADAIAAEMLKVVSDNGYTANFCDVQQYVRKILINCFHEETLIVTCDGIKNIKDVRVGDMVYSINPVTSELELKPVIDTQQYDYDGSMIRFNNKTVDVCVTPEHNMVGRKQHQETYSFTTANDVDGTKYIMPTHKSSLVRTYDDGHLTNLVEYCSDDLFNDFNFYKFCDGEKVLLDVSSKEDIRILYEAGADVFVKSRRDRKCGYNRIFVNTNIFSAFVGWYISEGCLYTTKPNPPRGISNKITICQYRTANPDYYNEIVDVVEYMSTTISNSKLVSKYTKSEKSVGFSSDFIAHVIDNTFGRSTSKCIYKNGLGYDLSERVLFDTLYKGDGNKQSNRYTISTKYADLFQDFVLLSVRNGYIPRYYIESGCYRIINTNTEQHIHIEKSKNSEEYNGNVYCVTVKDNHTVLAGSNGKFSWTGQSFYGVLGTPYFGFYNPKNAAAVTIWGRTIIQYISNEINKYVKEEWHQKACQLLCERFPNVKQSPSIVKDDVIVLIDTDSNYVHLKPLIDSCGLTLTLEEFREFADIVSNNFFKPMFTQKMDEFAASYNIKSHTFNFKQEKTISQMFVVKKKKYAVEVIAKEGKIYKSPEIDITGIEVVRTSTPIFCVSRLKEAIRMLFDTMNKKMLLEYIKKTKEEFMIQDIDNITTPSTVNDYGKYANGIDMTSATVPKVPLHCPQHVKASIMYNYMIEKMGWNDQPISDNSKIKYTYVKKNNILNTEVIAYMGEWNDKLAEHFVIDREVQFYKKFTRVVERFFETLGWGKINLNVNELENFMQF